MQSRKGKLQQQTTQFKQKTNQPDNVFAVNGSQPRANNCIKNAGRKDKSTEKKKLIYPNTQIGFMKKQIGKTESDSNNQEIAAACVPELLRQQFESNQQYDYDINEAYRMENNPLDDDNLYRFMNYSMEDNSFLTIGKSQERAKSKDNTNYRSKKKPQIQPPDGLFKYPNNGNNFNISSNYNANGISPNFPDDTTGRKSPMFNKYSSQHRQSTQKKVYRMNPMQ